MQAPIGFPKMLQLLEALGSASCALDVLEASGSKLTREEAVRLSSENARAEELAEEFPGICCDAYCEDGAWSVEVERWLQFN